MKNLFIFKFIDVLGKWSSHFIFPRDSSPLEQDECKCHFSKATRMICSPLQLHLKIENRIVRKWNWIHVLNLPASMLAPEFIFTHICLSLYSILDFFLSLSSAFFGNDISLLLWTGLSCGFSTLFLWIKLFVFIPKSRFQKGSRGQHANSSKCNATIWAVVMLVHCRPSSCYVCVICSAIGL